MGKAKSGSRTMPRVQNRPRPRDPAAVLAEDERRLADLARRQEARAEAASRRRKARLRKAAVVAAVLLVVGGLLATAILREAGKPGDSVGQQPSPHIAGLIAPHAPYSTDPPTSGPHVKELPAWGAATTPVPKELQVHGLEDGGVIISYQPSLDPAMIAKLTALTGGYDSKLILTPEPGLGTSIVLTAWGRMQRFPQYDEAGIRRFIEAYRGVDHHQESGS
ncbi:MAG: DUF3105 domain-containing protein [Chloroflexia bacterium]